MNKRTFIKIAAAGQSILAPGLTMSDIKPVGNPIPTMGQDLKSLGRKAEGVLGAIGGGARSRSMRPAPLGTSFEMGAQHAAPAPRPTTPPVKPQVTGPVPKPAPVQAKAAPKAKPAPAAPPKATPKAEPVKAAPKRIGLVTGKGGGTRQTPGTPQPAQPMKKSIRGGKGFSKGASVFIKQSADLGAAFLELVSGSSGGTGNDTWEQMKQSPATTALIGAGTGAAIGGVAGAIQGGPGNRMSGAAKGAGLGAVGGAALGGLGATAGAENDQYQKRKKMEEFIQNLLSQAHQSGGFRGGDPTGQFPGMMR
jgi:hypothetical protein